MSSTLDSENMNSSKPGPEVQGPGEHQKVKEPHSLGSLLASECDAFPFVSGRGPGGGKLRGVKRGSQVPPDFLISVVPASSVCSSMKWAQPVLL